MRSCLLFLSLLCATPLLGVSDPETFSIANPAAFNARAESAMKEARAQLAALAPRFPVLEGIEKAEITGELYSKPHEAFFYALKFKKNTHQIPGGPESQLVEYRVVDPDGIDFVLAVCSDPGLSERFVTLDLRNDSGVFEIFCHTALHAEDGTNSSSVHERAPALEAALREITQTFARTIAGKEFKVEEVKQPIFEPIPESR